MPHAPALHIPCWPIAVVQGVPSATAAFLHVPDVTSQVSTVQSLPSSHVASSGVLVQAPVAALHVSTVHQTPSSHGGSVWQVAEQPSQFTVLPSSHCSPGSMIPLPQGGPAHTPD